MLVLIARVAWLERAVGQDRLVRWHRRTAPWALGLICAHVVLITLGYAQSSKTGVLRQMWVFLSSYPDMLAAAVAFGLLVMVAVTSVRIARRRLKYETWWVVHLYTYIALSLAFAHQIATGVTLCGPPPGPGHMGDGLGIDRRARHLLPRRPADRPQPPPPVACRVGPRGGARRVLDRLPRAPNRPPRSVGGPVLPVALSHPGPVVAGAPIFAVCPAPPADGASDGKGSRRPQPRRSSAQARAPGCGSRGPTGPLPTMPSRRAGWH